MIYSQTQRNEQAKSVMVQSVCFRNDNFEQNSKKTVNGILNSLTITESRMTEGKFDKIIQCNQNNASAKTTGCQSCAMWDDWIIYFQHQMLKIEQRMIEKQKLLQNKLKQLTNQLVMHKEMVQTTQLKYENQKHKNQQLVTQLKELQRQYSRTQYQRKTQKNVNDCNCDPSNKLCKIKNNNKSCKNIVNSFKNKQNQNQFQTDINPTQRNYNIGNKTYKKLSCSIQHLPQETAIQNNETFQQYGSQQKFSQKNKQLSLQKAKINNFHHILTYQSIYNQSIDTLKNPMQQKEYRNLKLAEKKDKNQNFGGLLSFVENDSRQSLPRNQRHFKQIVQEDNMKNYQTKLIKYQNQLQNQIKSKNNLIQSKQISQNNPIPNNQFNKTLKNISQHNQIHRSNKKQVQLTTKHNISNTINLSHLKSQYQNENRKPNHNSQNNLISQSQKSFLFQRNTFTSNKSSQPQNKVSISKTIKLNLNNCQINVQKSRFNQTTDCSFLNDWKNGNNNQNKIFDNQYNYQRLGWEIGEPKMKNNKTKKQDGLQQKNKKKVLEEMQKLKIENQNLKSYNRVLLQKLSNSRPKKY